MPKERPGVAVDDLDVLEGYLQLVGRQLGEGGLVPLAVECEPVKTVIFPVGVTRT
jgi:hypothetical protein